jgi:predicted Rdx family selenoprotein
LSWCVVPLPLEASRDMGADADALSAKTHVPRESGDNKEDGHVSAQKVLLWDRKAEGGFPGRLAMRVAR